MRPNAPGFSNNTSRPVACSEQSSLFCPTISILSVCVCVRASNCVTQELRHVGGDMSGAVFRPFWLLACRLRRFPSAAALALLSTEGLFGCGDGSY